MAGGLGSPPFIPSRLPYSTMADKIEGLFAQSQRVDDTYAPRRSTRVSADHTPADGDTWYERVTVCEGATASGSPRLVVRSYFRNQRSQERVWDEPPSGASKIKYVTPDVRAKALSNMADLQATLDMIPPEEGKEVPVTLPLKKEKQRAGMFRKLIANPRKKEKQPDRRQINESQDVNLQRAIARSMADMNGKSEGDEPIVYFDTEGPQQPKSRATARPQAEIDDVDMAMAKALSMSEADPHSQSTDILKLSEEEQLRIVLEQSRIEAGHANKDDSEMDRKMPAVARYNPFDSPPQTPTKYDSTFDPYSPITPASPEYVSTTNHADAEDLLALPSTDVGSTRQKESQSGKPKRNLGRMFGGNRRKVIEDEAGVV